jgi:hypothetical protein
VTVPSYEIILETKNSSFSKLPPSIASPQTSWVGGDGHFMGGVFFASRFTQIAPSWHVFQQKPIMNKTKNSTL